MLTLEDFDQYDWQAIAASAKERDCSTYSPMFHLRGKELAEAGDELGLAVFQLLSDCTSSWLDSGSRDDPFRPMVKWGTSRSPIPGDIPDSQIALLPDLASVTRDAELRARLADIAWLRGHNYRMAQLAIDSYIEAAKQLDDSGNWVDAKDRVERALRLAAQLGKGGREKFDTVVLYIEGVLVHIDAVEDRRFQPLQLMELLIDLRTGDVSKWSALSTTLAERAEVESDWHRAGAYWDIKASWERRRPDEQAAIDAQVRAAEMEVYLARDHSEGESPNYFVAAMHLQRAVEGMRQANNPQRAEALHSELLRIQKLGMSQMQRIGHEIDISSYTAAAINAVQGMPLDSALIALVTLQDVPSADSLREHVDRAGKEFVLSSLFPTRRVDHQGRTVGERTSRLSSDPEEVEAAKEADIFDLAGQYHQGYVAMFIEPARGQIALEHPVRMDDLKAIVVNNPLVPSGRGSLVLRGLYAGLVGDFVLACHLLIPQIEQSIRHVLNLNGIVTTSLNSNGIQEEQDLSRLLQRGEAIKIWGEDLVLDLRGLLVERFGANLRNRLAHGLVDEQEFNSWQGPYLWWIALRFYFLPILINLENDDSGS